MTRAGKLERLLARFAERHVLVLGDLMLDEYLWGAVSRISPEAPVPVVAVRSESLRLGGAGNVAANLRALGARVSVVGCVGDDVAGERLVHELEAQGIKADGVGVVRGRPTTVKSRVVAGSQHVVRFDREVVSNLPPAVVRQLAAATAARLREADALLVSDYAKGVIGPGLLQRVLPPARRQGLPIVADPKVPHLALFRRVTLVTPNHHEAAQATGRPLSTEADLVAIGAILQKRLGGSALLITRGEQGMTLFEPDGTVTHIPAVAQEVYDVTGAGDTVAATLTLALAAGASFRVAAVLANHAAGCVVGKVGTATVSRSELVRAAGGSVPGL